MQTISMFKLPQSEWFPSYVAEHDQFAMMAMCQTELAAWRAEVALHKRLPTVNKKMDHRKTLERSYDDLEAAWATANEVVEVEPMLMAA